MRIAIFILCLIITTTVLGQETYGHSVFGRKVSLSGQVGSAHVPYALIPTNIPEASDFGLRYGLKMDVVLSRVVSMEFTISQFQLEKREAERDTVGAPFFVYRNSKYWVKSAEFGFRRYLNYTRSATVSNGVYFSCGLRYTQNHNGSDFIVSFMVNDSMSRSERFKVDVNLVNFYLGFGVERIFGKRTALYAEAILHLPYIETKREFLGDLSGTGRTESSFEIYIDSRRKELYLDSFFYLNGGMKFYLF